MIDKFQFVEQAAEEKVDLLFAFTSIFDLLILAHSAIIRNFKR